MSRQFKDGEWTIRPDCAGNYSSEQGSLSVLMDIRDQLHEMRKILEKIRTRRQPKFIAGPRGPRGK